MTSTAFVNENSRDAVSGLFFPRAIDVANSQHHLAVVVFDKTRALERRGARAN